MVPRVNSKYNILIYVKMTQRHGLILPFLITENNLKH